MAWRILTFASAVLKASDLNQIRNNFQLLADHLHTGASGDGAAVLSAALNVGVVSQIQIFPRYPTASTGVITYSADANLRLGTAITTASNSDDTQWTVALAAGTYTCNVLLDKTGANQGQATLYLDASSIGSIEAYTAGTVYNVFTAITGIVVAASGQKTFKVKTTGKNASSGGYNIGWQAIEFYKTA